MIGTTSESADGVRALNLLDLAVYTAVFVSFEHLTVLIFGFFGSTV